MKKIVTEKLWTLMKIGTIQLLLATITCVITLAHTTHAQLLEQKLSISVHEESFDSILYQIETKTNVKFAYSIDQLQVDEKITLVAANQSLKQILEQLLEPYDIGYKLHESENTITLKKKASNTIRYTTPLGVQQIEGLVTDAQQQPLAGVNIIISGTTNGTTTNAEGRYSLFVNEGDVVVFSFIGFTTQSVTIKNQTILDIVMTEDLESLKEVVVNAGYWEVKDIERTGNISRIDAEIIEKQPVNNPLQAMQGRMPGVYIQQNSGVPGSSFKIQIRGQNSLRKEGNEPLYVVDGIPFTSNSLTSSYISNSIIQEGNPLATINPADIESIEVLKDADATAIYGSRGSNGVVLITTKKSNPGKTSITFNFSQGVGSIAREMELLDSRQYTNMRLEAVRNAGYEAFLDNPAFDSFWPDLKIWDTTRYTNWQKELIGGNANQTNAQFSLTGGNANTWFSFRGGYYRETTVFPGDFAFQRASGALDVNHTSLNEKFSIALAITYSNTINDLNSIDLTNTAMTLMPTAPPLYTNSGEINWDWPGSTLQNPAAVLLRKYNSGTENSFSNLTFSYEILKGFKFKTSMGFNTMRMNETIKNPLSARPPQSGATASAVFGSGKLNTWLMEPQMEYSKTIGMGKIIAMVGLSFQESVQEGNALESTGYSSDALLDNPMAGKQQRLVNSNYLQYRYTALFGRINYTLKDKYIFNLTARRDGSSRFGNENRFGNFGALGVAWIFSNEKWLDALSVLSFGKLRMSYGLTGSDAIGDYQYLNSFSSTSYPYNNTSGLVVTRLNNPDYSWESNKKFETGIEIGVLNNRITLSTSYYKNLSSNQLVGLPVAQTTGQSSVQYNFPATVQNTGWEITTSSTNISKNTITWSTDFNISIPRNKVLEFPDLESFPAYKNRYKVGESVYTKNFLHGTGVDPETGLYTFQDTDGNTAIEYPKDAVFLKTTTQHWFGGINNTLQFKGIQFDFFIQFVKQTGLNYRTYYGTPGSFSNQPTDVLQRWQQPGDQSSIQLFTIATAGNAAYNNARFSDYSISDASFIRVKNVSLSWTVSSSVLKRIKLQAAKIYLQGQNLFTLSDYKGLDPENQIIGYLPPLRMVTAGFQITL